MLVLYRITYATAFLLFLSCNFVPWETFDHIADFSIPGTEYSVPFMYFSMFVCYALDWVMLLHAIKGNTPFHVSRTHLPDDDYTITLLIQPIALSFAIGTIVLWGVAIVRLMLLFASLQRLIFLASVYHVHGKRPFCPSLAPASPTSDAKKEE